MQLEEEYAPSSWGYRYKTRRWQFPFVNKAPGTCHPFKQRPRLLCLSGRKGGTGWDRSPLQATQSGLPQQPGGCG